MYTPSPLHDDGDDDDMRNEIDTFENEFYDSGPFTPAIHNASLPSHSLPQNFSELFIPSPALNMPTPHPQTPLPPNSSKRKFFGEGFAPSQRSNSLLVPVPISPTLRESSLSVPVPQQALNGSSLNIAQIPVSNHPYEQVYMGAQSSTSAMSRARKGGIKPFEVRWSQTAQAETEVGPMDFQPEPDLSPAPVVRASIRHNLYRMDDSSEEEDVGFLEQKESDHLRPDMLLNQWMTSGQIATPKRLSTPGRPKPLDCGGNLANYLDLSKPLESLEHWGIPAELAEAYKKHAGIGSLYGWQAECVNQPSVIAGGNLVYSAPTSGGKTLVAEILMVRRLLFERQRRVKLLRQSSTAKTTKINEGPGSGGKALFVLPYVSIVTEKGRYFNKIFGGKKTSWPNRIRVQTFYSQTGGSMIPKNVDVAICTIEKANVLINHMMEDGTFSQLVCVVIDEMHMMGEQDRGYLLELLISKVRFKIAWDKAQQTAKSEHNILLSPPVIRGASPLPGDDSALRPSQLRSPSQQDTIDPARDLNAVQLVGLSATLSNGEDLCKWLEAALYVTHFRPVPLTEYYKIGNTLYGKNLMPVREVSPLLPANFGAPLRQPVAEKKVQALIQKFKFHTNMAAQQLKKLDGDHIIQLTWEVVSQDKSVLVFCASREGCEKVCSLLAQGLPLARAVTNGVRILGEISSEVNGIAQYATFNSAQAEIALQQPPVDELKQAPRLKLLQKLTNTPFGLDHILSDCVKHGIAYHHAGMTIEERDLVEEAFRKGHLRVLCATSTLAAGVNLPGKRVIFRSARVGIAELDPIKYRQMSGRAGRAGKDDSGESILVIPLQDNQRNGQALAESLMVAPLPCLQSCLTDGPGGIGMTRILLEAMAAGIVGTTDQIKLFITCTLFYVQCPFAEVHQATKSALRYLSQHEFIIWQKSGQIYQASKLGKATFASSLAPPSALVVYQGLAKATKELVLEGDLHLLYLLAPVSHIEPKWNRLLQFYEHLNGNLKHAVDLIGIDMGFVVKNITKKPSFDDPKVVRHRRLWVAFILLDLINEVPINTVAAKYELNRGVVQNLQKEAAQFAGMVTVFCKRLNYTFFEMLASEYCDRLQFGVGGELVPLMELAPNLPPTVVRTLFAAGFVTVEAVAEANPAELVRVIRNSVPFHGASAPDEDTAQPTTRDMQAKEMRMAQVLCRGAHRVLRARGQEQAKECAKMDLALAPIKEGGDAALQDNEPTIPMSAEKPFQAAAASGQSLLTPGGLSSKRLRPDSVEQKKPAFKIAPKIVPAAPDGSLGVGKASGPNIINVGLSVATFEKFIEEWEKAPVFAWAIYGVKVPQDAPCVGKHSPGDFVKFIMPGELEALTIMREDISGMAVSWALDVVYLIPLTKDAEGEEDEDGEAVAPELAWESIYDMMANPKNTKVAFDMKTQLKLLHIAGAQQVKGHLQDPRIAHWLINPEEKRLLTIKHFFNHYVTNNSKLASNLAASPGAGSEERSTLALDGEQCARQVWQSLWVMSKLKQMLANQKLLHAFETVEMPLVPVLTDMELVGMGFDKTGYCHHNFEVISKIQHLELTAHELAGREFNLTSTNEVSQVLFGDLGLEAPPIARKKKSSKLSVGAMVLEHLSRLPNPHPLPAVIHEHRKLNHFLCKYVASLPRAAVYSPRFAMNRVHGTIIQTHAATGRLCVITPNLQSISKEINFTPSQRYSVQDELEAGILEGGPNGEVKYSGKLSVQSANNMQVLMVSTKSKVGFSNGTLVSILRSTVGEPYGDEKHESLAEFWAKRGHVYGPEKAHVMQVRVEIRLGEKEVVYTYPADKVWRCAAYVSNVSKQARNPLHKTESRIFKPQEASEEKVEGLVMPWQQEVKFSVRAAFVAAPGFLLLSADYSQIELRLLAHFSQEASLIKQLWESGSDIFRVIGSSLYHIPQDKVSVDQRNHAKKIVYGLLYGAGTLLLSHELEMPFETCQHFVESFRRAYPALPRYLSEVIADCRKRGYVVTLAGRRRYLPQIYSSVAKERAAAERQAFNTISQGSAADLIKLAMVRIDNSLTKFQAEEAKHNSVRLIMQIHDELLYEVREDCMSTVQDLVREGMTSCVKISVPLGVKMSVGSDWASLVTVKDKIPQD